MGLKQLPPFFDFRGVVKNIKVLDINPVIKYTASTICSIGNGIMLKIPFDSFWQFLQHP
jgi:hypothetical protein